MNAAIIRILLRYASAALVARGYLSEGDGSMLASDPDLAMALETGLGIACGALAEGWYWAANRYGWAK